MVRRFFRFLDCCTRGLHGLAGSELLEVIHVNEEPIDRGAFFKLLAHAGAVTSAPVLPTILRELVSSAQLSTLSSTELRTALTEFYQAHLIHDDATVLILGIITEPAILYDDLLVTEPFQGRKIIDYDWSRIKELRPEMQILETGKRSLKRQMEELVEQAIAIRALIDELNGVTSKPQVS